MLRHVWIVPLLLAVPPALAQQSAPQTINGMQRVPGTKVAIAYMMPGLDLSHYKTIQLMPLNVPATARNTLPTGDTPQFGEVWVIPDYGVARLKKTYDNVMREELAKGGIQFVTMPQADTLVVAAEIKNIQLNAPIENLNAGPISGSLTRGVGSMVLAVAFADGVNGKVVAMAEDRKVGDDRWTSSNSTGNMFEAGEAFRDWAVLLRTRLTQAGTGPRPN
jgi:hypothetical protein